VLISNFILTIGFISIRRYCGAQRLDNIVHQHTSHFCTAPQLTPNSQGDNYRRSLNAIWKALIDGQSATGRYRVTVPSNTHNNITQHCIIWSVLCPLTSSLFKPTMMTTVAAGGASWVASTTCHSHARVSVVSCQQRCAVVK